MWWTSPALPESLQLKPTVANMRRRGRETGNVMRFWDNEVLGNIEGVKEKIWAVLAEHD